MVVHMTQGCAMYDIKTQVLLKFNRPIKNIFGRVEAPGHCKGKSAVVYSARSQFIPHGHNRHRQ